MSLFKFPSFLNFFSLLLLYLKNDLLLYFFLYSKVFLHAPLLTSSDIDQWNKVTELLATPPQSFFDRLQPSVSFNLLDLLAFYCHLKSYFYLLVSVKATMAPLVASKLLLL